MSLGKHHAQVQVSFVRLRRLVRHRRHGRGDGFGGPGGRCACSARWPSIDAVPMARSTPPKADRRQPPARRSTARWSSVAAPRARALSGLAAQHAQQPALEVGDLRRAHRMRHRVLVPLDRVAERDQRVARLARARDRDHRIAACRGRGRSACRGWRRGARPRPSPPAAGSPTGRPGRRAARRGAARSSASSRSPG